MGGHIRAVHAGAPRKVFDRLAALDPEPLGDQGGGPEQRDHQAIDQRRRMRAHRAGRQARDHRGDREGDVRDDERDRLLGVFDVLAELAASAGFRGCAFYNASAEESTGTGAVAEVCAANRAWTRELFIGLARDAGAHDPEALAAQLMILYDGSTVGARMDRTAGAATTARVIAAALLAAATA